MKKHRRLAEKGTQILTQSGGETLQSEKKITLPIRKIHGRTDVDREEINRYREKREEPQKRLPSQKTTKDHVQQQHL